MHLLKTLHNTRRSSEEVSISDARGRIEQLDIAFQHGCLDTEAKQRIQQLESLFRRRHLTSEQEPSGSSNRGDVYFSPQVTRRAKSLLESLQPHELSLSPRLGIRASLRRSECPEREAEQLDPNDFVRSGFGRCSSRSLGSHSETIEEENFDDRDEDGEEGVCYQTLSAVPSAAAIQPSFGCSEQPPLEQHPQAQLQPQRQQRGTSDGLAESGGKQTAIAQHAGEERGIRNLRKSVSVHGDLVQFPCRALPRRISEGNLDLSRAQPPPLPPPRKPGLIPRAASKTSLRKSSDECGSGKCRITRRSQSVVEGHSPGLRKEFEHVARQVERAQSLNSSCESPRLRRVPSDASTPQSSRRRNSVSSGYEDLSVSWNERYIGTPDVRVISNGQHHPARVICQQKSSFDSTISCLSQTADSCPRSAAQGTDNTYFVKPKSTDSPRNSLNAKHDKSPSQGEDCQFSRADTKRRARRQNSYTFKPISVPDDEDDADELNPTPTQSNCDIPIKEWLQTMFPGLETADRENLESFIMDSSERAKRLLQSRGVRIPLLQRSNSQDTKRPNDVDLKRPDFPCFWKTHARTPSDGSQEVAKLLKSPSQGDRPLQAVTPPNEDKPGIFQRMFRRSQSRERTPGPPSDNEKSPEKSRKHKNKQIEVKIKRYRSLSPRPYECPTPPLAMFSSDEDISSVPQTPEHTPQKAFESQPTISPQLESQISKLMLEPVKPRVANASTTTSRDAIGDNRKPRPISIATTGDYPQHKPPTGKGLRKSSAGAALARVYAADLPPQISISPAKPLPPKPLPAKPRTKYTREYREKRHHTLDLGGMQHENSKSQVTTLRSHSMGSRADQADIQAKTLRKQYAASKDIVISAPNPQIKGHSLPILDPAGQTPLQIGSNDSGFNQDEVSSDCLKLLTIEGKSCGATDDPIASLTRMLPTMVAHRVHLHSSLERLDAPGIRPAN
ncbi:hypothetical protein CAPTEDRAFT_226686 [Capitella teleta]|uniref:Uncharacterized protein n=1 Tax=Capitella teleta TaxID=283909 RepID=R7U262_CAPTE|nr:hypothetical protein CAPTEDRAFT_226686 [Capitella teleta]|eukprot:ELT97751.1 hypothetical protein CAPTEDRAFT_226686 [Capitella teleta]